MHCLTKVSAWARQVDSGRNIDWAQAENLNSNSHSLLKVSVGKLYNR